MKILVLKSSGNNRGSSAILADEFIRGARENGHEITEYNLIRKDIRPCTGCNACGMDGPCVQKDDYETICDYMQFTDCGVILGGGCGTPDMTRRSKYPEEAYELGKSI